MRDGASWTQSNYDHMPTYTAPGHGTMMTGAYPAESGIIGNEWLDRATGKRVTSVSDESVKLLGGLPNDPASSPWRLMASTVGDELRLATNDRAKVIGISVKDRSAILPAGRHANAAYWFSWTSGTMVSSTYYFNQLPAWVTGFNAAKPADKYFGAKWERLLPESEYIKRAGPDNPSWENVTAAGDTNSFPHTITGGAKSPRPKLLHRARLFTFHKRHPCFVCTTGDRQRATGAGRRYRRADGEFFGKRLRWSSLWSIQPGSDGRHAAHRSQHRNVARFR